MSVVVGVAAYGALAAACADSEIAEVVGVVLLIHGQTEAEFAASVTSFFHHLREGLAVPPSIPVVLLKLQLLHLNDAFDYVLLPFPPAALPVVQILKRTRSLYYRLSFFD